MIATTTTAPRVSSWFQRFLLLTGYRGEQIEAFIAGERWPAEVGVRCLPTGIDTPTTASAMGA